MFKCKKKLLVSGDDRLDVAETSEHYGTAVHHAVCTAGGMFGAQLGDDWQRLFEGVL